MACSKRRLLTASLRQLDTKIDIVFLMESLLYSKYVFFDSLTTERWMMGIGIFVSVCAREIVNRTKMELKNRNNKIQSHFV